MSHSKPLVHRFQLRASSRSNNQQSEPHGQNGCYDWTQLDGQDSVAIRPQTQSEGPLPSKSIGSLFMYPTVQTHIQIPQFILHTSYINNQNLDKSGHGDILQH